MRTKKSIELNDFSPSKLVSEMFYNYNPSVELKNTMGVNVAKFPILSGMPNTLELNIAGLEVESVEGIAYFKQYFANSGDTIHRLLVYCNDKKLYLNELLDGSTNLYWLYELTFNSPPIALAFKIGDNDAIILAGNDKMVIWETNFSPYTVTNAPIITSMCMNEGALFCTLVEPAFKIWYATDLKAENIGKLDSNSGYIVLADDLGYARKIVTYDESVYVFRDYGISKINNVKGEMSVSQVYLSRTKIFTNTVAICGNIILFLTKDGLYSFNGVKVTRTNIDISKFLPTENNYAVGSSLGNYYYLALKLDMKDGKQMLCEAGEYKNNTLIVVDINSYDYQIIRGVDIKTLLPVMAEDFESMLLTFNSVYTDKVGQVISTPCIFTNDLEKLWTSAELTKNFNNKLFTHLTVTADENIKFKLIHDAGETSFTTYQTGKNEFCFKIMSNTLKLEISSPSSSGEVKRVLIDYYEY